MRLLTCKLQTALLCFYPRSHTNHWAIRTSLVGSIPTAIQSGLDDLGDTLKSFTAFLPPSSIASVLETAIPADIRSSIAADPTAALEFNSALHSSLKAGQTPAWYNDLPSDVKSYLNKLGGITGTAGAGPTGTAAGSDPAQTSDNYAARATGAVAASLAGAAGLLGLAFAL